MPIRSRNPGSSCNYTTPAPSHRAYQLETVHTMVNNFTIHTHRRSYYGHSTSHVLDQFETALASLPGFIGSGMMPTSNFFK